MIKCLCSNIESISQKHASRLQCCGFLLCTAVSDLLRQLADSGRSSAGSSSSCQNAPPLSTSGILKTLAAAVQKLTRRRIAAVTAVLQPAYVYAGTAASHAAGRSMSLMVLNGLPGWPLWEALAGLPAAQHLLCGHPSDLKQYNSHQQKQTRQCCCRRICGHLTMTACWTRPGTRQRALQFNIHS